LAQDQFEIFDQDEVQRIEYFAGERSATSFGIVYDMHPTTKEQTAAVLDSLRGFSRGLSAADTFFVVAFNERGSLTLDFVPTEEQIEAQLSGKVKSPEPNSLYDAVYLAAEKLRRSKNAKRSLLIISDSEDHRSQHRFSQLRDNVRNFDVQVYAIILGVKSNLSYWDWTRGGPQRERKISGPTELDRAALEELARKSGGESKIPYSNSARALGEIYREIQEELRQQYTLSFYSKHMDGTWHKLKVRLRDPQMKKYSLSYRRSYRAPAPEKPRQ
jgi:VWFA-related protein